MGNKVAVVLSGLALVVALLGSTSAGRAALDAVVPVPLAKHAYLADTARNAIKVNNIRASRTPTAGMLVPLDASGKLPNSIGAVGPKGDRGEKGDSGATRVVVRVGETITGSGTSKTVGSTEVDCAPGEVAVGGGGGATSRGTAGVTLFDSKPTPNTDGATPTGWNAGLIVDPGYSGAAYVVCAKP